MSYSEENGQLDSELYELMLTMWPNCETPDCDAKVCIGLSETKCYPCATGKPRDANGGAIPPATPEEVASWRETVDRFWEKRFKELEGQ